MRRTSTRLPCYLNGTEALSFALNREGVSELVPCVSLGRKWIPAFPAKRMQISTHATDEYSPALIHLEVPAKKFLLKKPRGFNLIVCHQCENALHFSNPHLQGFSGAVTEASGFFLCFQKQCTEIRALPKTAEGLEVGCAVDNVLFTNLGMSIKEARGKGDLVSIAFT